MNAIEIIAVVFAIVFLLKLALLLAYPRQVMRFSVRVLRKNIVFLRALYLVAGVVVGYFVLTSIPLVAVAAVVLFSALVFKFTLVSYPEEIELFARELARRPASLLKRAWLPVLFWAILAVCVLWSVIR